MDASTTPAISAAPAAPRRRKGERTAERILDAAEALFAQRGYAGATLRDVAAKVGLRTPSLYNHFPNKESIWRTSRSLRSRASTTSVSTSSTGLMPRSRTAA